MRHIFWTLLASMEKSAFDFLKSAFSWFERGRDREREEERGIEIEKECERGQRTFRLKNLATCYNIELT